MKHKQSTSRAMLTVLLLLTSTLFLKAGENAADSWEVEIITKGTNEVAKSGTVFTNSYLLEGLECGIEYFAKIRTKNIVLSDWVISDVFLLDPLVGLIPVRASDLVLSSDNGLLFISSDVAQQVNIYGVDGCLQRSVSLSAGKTTVDGLTKGLYLVDGQKIIVK